MATLLTNRPDEQLESIAGAIRRFGPFGPVYEVTGAAGPDARGREQVRIRVVESGEELDYPVDEVRADPGE